MRSRPLLLLIAFLLALFPGSVVAARGQERDARAVEPSSAPVDLAIWLSPAGSDGTRVAIAYRTAVAHSRVKAEIAHLEQETGGRAANLEIADDSIYDAARARRPKTTTALFTLTRASPVRDNAPILRPYIAAFQKWDRLMILVTDAALNPYRGVEDFVSDALAIHLAQRAETMARYEVQIRDHTGELPEIPARAAVTAPPAKTEGQDARSDKELALMLVLAGAGILGGAGLYFVLNRRSQQRAGSSLLQD